MNAKHPMELGKAATGVLGLDDVAMPGMTGIELAQIARDKRPGLPILLVTGYADLPACVLAKLPRLAKPYHQAELQAAVEALLDSARANSKDAVSSAP